MNTQPENQKLENRPSSPTDDFNEVNEAIALDSITKAWGKADISPTDFLNGIATFVHSQRWGNAITKSLEQAAEISRGASLKELQCRTEIESVLNKFGYAHTLSAIDWWISCADAPDGYATHLAIGGISILIEVAAEDEGVVDEIIWLKKMLDGDAQREKELKQSGTVNDDCS